MSTDQRVLELLAERAPEVSQLLQQASARVRASASLVLDCSAFVADVLAADAGLLSRIEADELAQPPHLAGDEAGYMAQLRRWRRRELARIAWRDLAGFAPLERTLQELSAAADMAIRSALVAAGEVLQSRYGCPRGADGRALDLSVIAMGKLGGGELNFSSDIDLIFLFPEHGDTDGVRSIANEEYFTRLGQLSIRYLDQNTADGFVYRVDMRLRPFGDSGPLVSSFAALEDYLERHGRGWERYAWVKARAVTGADDYRQLFDQVVRPFVYRRYLDFGVFESLREMKGLIEREVERRELHDNIKLGPGGIREIEFIVQAFQLIRGGQDRRLQSVSLLQTLPRLVGDKLLPAQAAEQLGAAYRFLRRLENRLQMLADQQTHDLPSDPAARAVLACAMGAADWQTLAMQLAQHRRSVGEHFAAIVFDGGSPGPAPAALGAWWESSADAAQLTVQLAALGFDVDATATAQLLVDFGGSTLLRRLDEESRRRLVALMRVLLEEIRREEEPLAVLRRLVRIIEAIGTRSVYFALLLVNGNARRRLVQLAGRGDFLVSQIAAHPLLLDELIDARLFEQLPTRAAMAEDLAERMAQMHEEGEERQVEQLRHFQRAAVFRIAVADLTGQLPVMQVSDRLTDVAELIVEQAMQLTWQHLVAQLGEPRCLAGEMRRVVNICAVGYGKLAGMELGYGSDLDLVFLHDSTGESQHTDGARSVDNQVFFVRFVQRLVHLLSMHSAAGRLYEIDTRLRPSGKGGMLITSIEAFAAYQQAEAWTWEHQALLHARAVAGAASLQRRFETVRSDILQHHVRRDTLQAEVRQMRERMRRELGQSDSTRFDLKKDRGGIADIEFLAQYWALKWAAEYPPVAMFSDTIRQLESVASAALVPQSIVDVLTGAYRRYRERIHHLSLEGQESIVAADTLATEREAVSAVWNEAMQV